MKKTLLTIASFIILLAPQLAHADITSNLQGYWAFDEGSGTTAIDSSGTGNTGTLTNGATYAAGKIGPYSVNLVKASSQFVDVPSSSSLNITSDFTLSAWVNFSSMPTNGDGYEFITKDSNTGGRAYTMDFIVGSVTCGGEINAFRIYINGGGTLSGAGTNQLDACVTPTLGAWNLMTAVFDHTAQTLTIYINGTQITQVGSTVTSVPTATSDVNIGAREYSGFQDYFDGKIDDARIYNRALSSSDVTQLFNYTKPVATIIPTTISLGNKIMVMLGSVFKINLFN